MLSCGVSICGHDLNPWRLGVWTTDFATNGTELGVLMADTEAGCLVLVRRYAERPGVERGLVLSYAEVVA
jgi:hypothetical protein